MTFMPLKVAWPCCLHLWPFNLGDSTSADTRKLQCNW